MSSTSGVRRTAFGILCVAPLLIGPLTGSRALRIPGAHEVLGVLLFALMAAAAWSLARPGAGSRDPLALLDTAAGVLLLSPMALIALFWVGLGTPWDATPSENRMRYAVILAGSIGVTSGYFLLKESLAEASERLYSTLALGWGSLSGAAYVVWSSFQLGDFALRSSRGEVTPSVAAMNDVLDALLFAAGVLAYAASAALALALGKTRRLGRNASRLFSALSLIAATLLCLRGVSFPVPGAGPAAWYTRPGFVVGIPAVPWFIPYFLGVVVLRRSGDRAA
jgi:hypothetical protein